MFEDQENNSDDGTFMNMFCYLSLINGREMLILSCMKLTRYTLLRHIKAVEDI